MEGKHTFLRVKYKWVRVTLQNTFIFGVLSFTTITIQRYVSFNKQIENRYDKSTQSDIVSRICLHKFSVFQFHLVQNRLQSKSIFPFNTLDVSEAYLPAEISRNGIFVFDVELHIYRPTFRNDSPFTFRDGDLCNTPTIQVKMIPTPWVYTFGTECLWGRHHSAFLQVKMGWKIHTTPNARHSICRAYFFICFATKTSHPSGCESCSYLGVRNTR